MDECAKSDYAANGGSFWGGYPCTSGNTPNGPTPKGGLLYANESSYTCWDAVALEYNGVVYAHSEIRLTSIQDGLSNTMLFGEKYIMTDTYEDFTVVTDIGEDSSPYAVSSDSYRFGCNLRCALPQAVQFV